MANGQQKAQQCLEAWKAKLNLSWFFCTHDLFVKAIVSKNVLHLCNFIRVFLVDFDFIIVNRTSAN